MLWPGDLHGTLLEVTDRLAIDEETARVGAKAQRTRP